MVTLRTAERERGISPPHLQEAPVPSVGCVCSGYSIGGLWQQPKPGKTLRKLMLCCLQDRMGVWHACPLLFPQVLGGCGSSPTEAPACVFPDFIDIASHHRLPKCTIWPSGSGYLKNLFPNKNDLSLCFTTNWPNQAVEVGDGLGRARLSHQEGFVLWIPFLIILCAPTSSFLPFLYPFYCLPLLSVLTSD